jgi:hypothetical protein
MSETLPTVVPTRQAIAVEGRSQKRAVTGKLKTALLSMVWEGEKRAAAAEKAGLADSSLRFALRKPHVLQFYHAELAALRTSLRARNLHRLDGSGNDMAKVSAIKAMENLADQADNVVRQPGTQSIPGLCIIINTNGGPPKVINPPTPPQIDGERVRIPQPQA